MVGSVFLRLKGALDGRVGKELVWAYDRKTPDNLIVKGYMTGGMREVFEMLKRRGRYGEGHINSLYEVIPNGVAVKFYLDMESTCVKKLSSWSYNLLQRLLRDIVHLIVTYINESFGLEVSVSDVLVLEASNAEKFSAHIVIERLVFADAQSCLLGFVAELCFWMKHKLQGVKQSSQETVNAMDEGHARYREAVEFAECIAHLSDEGFIDTAPYMRNQCWRVIQCSKLGSRRPLRVLDESVLDEYDSPEYWSSDERLQWCFTCDTRLFRKSLVQDVDPFQPRIYVRPCAVVCKALPRATAAWDRRVLERPSDWSNDRCQMKESARQRPVVQTLLDSDGRIRTAADVGFRVGDVRHKRLRADRGTEPVSSGRTAVSTEVVDVEQGGVPIIDGDEFVILDNGESVLASEVNPNPNHS